MSLTFAKIKAAKPRAKDYWLGDGDGLWLRVRASGTKTFIIRTKRAGRTHILTLGQWPKYSLQAARTALAKHSARPGAHISSYTVSELADEWFAQAIEPAYRRPALIRGYIDRAINPELGHFKARDIQRPAIVRMVQGYARRGPVAANRLLAITRQLFGYGVEAGYLPENPAAGLTRRVAGGRESSRDRVLDCAEIRALWWDDSKHVPLLRFLILTGQRIGEAQRAMRTHIDGPRWTIPAAHSKNGRAHWVHLSSAALEVIEDAKGGDGRLFRNVSLTATQAWLRRWCTKHDIEPFTPHDLRRTFATYVNEAGIAPHVVEKCLNHSLQGVMRTYNLAEYEAERIEAWNLWGELLTTIVGARP